MDSVREKVLRSVVAALGATGAPGQVFRSPQDPRSKSALPCFAVMAQKEQVQIDNREDVMRVLAVDVWCLVSAVLAEGESIDAKADPLITWAVRTIQADETLGGLAIQIDEQGVEWQTSSTDEEDIVGAKVSFLIQYSTKRGDPTASAA